MVMVPLTISDIDKIRLKLSMGELSTQGLSEYMINKCMIHPAAKDFTLMKPDYKDRIKLTIFFESGYDIYEEKKKTKQSKLSDKRKLYEMFAQDESYAMRTVLLQELGSYNFFNIPKLTKHEIKLLLQSKSKIIKKRRESTNG